MNKCYCSICQKETEYFVKEELDDYHSKTLGIDLPFKVLIPFCSECKNELFLNHIHLENIKRLREVEKCLVNQ
jgi:hypothetical protein